MIWIFCIDVDGLLDDDDDEDWVVRHLLSAK